jgi:hypothetical protein
MSMNLRGPSSIAIESAAGDHPMTSIIFLHHSVGGGLIDQGGLRLLLTARGYQFYDHGYNEDGLTLPGGEKAGDTFNIPDDNTDPDGLARIFSETPDLSQTSHPVTSTDVLSRLLGYDVIVFKSCFPASRIASDAQLEQYKQHYLAIRSEADQYPDHVFVALGMPPLDPWSTNPRDAARARAFTDWLNSPEFLAGHENLFAVDLFALLAENDPSKRDYNMLRADYRPNDGGAVPKPKMMVKGAVNSALLFVGSERRLGEGDPHPNLRANQAIAPVLAQAIDAAVTSYRALVGGLS